MDWQSARRSTTSMPWADEEFDNDPFAIFRPEEM
jgi:hypothetical protein